MARSLLSLFPANHPCSSYIFDATTEFAVHVFYALNAQNVQNLAVGSHIGDEIESNK